MRHSSTSGDKQGSAALAASGPWGTPPPSGRQPSPPGEASLYLPRLTPGTPPRGCESRPGLTNEAPFTTTRGHLAGGTCPPAASLQHLRAHAHKCRSTGRGTRTLHASHRPTLLQNHRDTRSAAPLSPPPPPPRHTLVRPGGHRCSLGVTCPTLTDMLEETYS